MFVPINNRSYRYAVQFYTVGKTIIRCMLFAARIVALSVHLIHRFCFEQNLPPPDPLLLLLVRLFLRLLLLVLFTRPSVNFDVLLWLASW